MVSTILTDWESSQERGDLDTGVDLTQLKELLVRFASEVAS
jgi:hypothetical protein